MYNLRRFFCALHNVAHRRVKTIELTLVMLAMTSCGSSKNIGQQLDDLQGLITSTGGLLGHTAGLAEAQMLDILKLRLQELRVELKDSLDNGVNTLDTEQAKTLDNIRGALDNVHGVIDHTTKLEDLAVLDINVFLAKFGISTANEVRRVEPSAQIHKHLGYYSYSVTLPLFGTGNKITGIRLNDTDVLRFKTDVKPHGFRIDIPQELLEGYFDDWKLGRATILIDLEVPSSKWWNPFSSPLKQTLVVDTGLFPRYPLRYWFAEHPHHTEVDMNPGHLQTATSPETTIPGCGNSGCYWSYDVCAVAPAGSIATGDVFDPHDSFQGWGSFIGGGRASANVVCWTYQQHSHNQNRNVWFRGYYHPTQDITDTQYYTLMPLDMPKTSMRQMDGTLFAVSFVPRSDGVLLFQGPLGQVMKTVERMSRLTIAAGASQINASANIPPPNGSSVPVANPSYTVPNGDTGPTPRAMEYGMTYFAPYHLGVNYELVVQAFTGEMIAATPTSSGGSKAQIQTSPENGERLLVTTHAPW